MKWNERLRLIFLNHNVVFVTATLLGFASHSPGGLGVFDAAMLVGLEMMDQEQLLAGMLLFRVLYYLSPFFISVMLLTFRELIVGARSKKLQAVATQAQPHTARPLNDHGGSGAG